MGPLCLSALMFSFTILLMSDPRQAPPMSHPPFQIVYNFRSPAAHSCSAPRKHRISKIPGTPMTLTLRRQRKMTAGIEIQGRLEHESMEVQPKGHLSEMDIRSEQEPAVAELDFQDCELGASELERIIPVELREDELDKDSPLLTSAFRNWNQGNCGKLWECGQGKQV